MAASHTFSFLLSRSALGLGSFPEQLSRIAVLQGFTQQSKLLQSFGLCEKQGFQHIHTSAKRQLKNWVSNSVQPFPVSHRPFKHISQKCTTCLPLSSQCKELPLWDKRTDQLSLVRKTGHPGHPSSIKCYFQWSSRRSGKFQVSWLRDLDYSHEGRRLDFLICQAPVSTPDLPRSTQLKFDLPHDLRSHFRCLLTYNFWLHTLLFGSLLLCHFLSTIARLSTQNENKKATVAIVAEAWPPLDFPVLYIVAACGNSNYFLSERTLSFKWKT